MDCPVCKIPLMVVERSKIELDYCHKCGGFWFDEGEIELLYDVLGIRFDIPDIHSADKLNTVNKIKNCPKCGIKMQKSILGGDIVDICPHKHGVWFDKGEISRIVNYFSNQNITSGEAKTVAFLGEVFNLKS